MTDLITIPLSDDFETTLASSWNGAVGTVSVNDVPDTTMPTSEYSYIVVNPGLSNMQVAKIDGFDGGAKTFNVTSIDVEKGNGTDYSSQTHATNSVVRFSNNYQFRKDIQTAINSKANQSEVDSLLGNFTITDSNIESTGSMTFSDGETAPVTLKTLTTGNGADQYVAVSENDTTVGHLEDKFNAGAGLSESIGTPGGNETLDVAVDTTDTDVFVKTSSGAGDEDKVPVLDASGKLAEGFIPDVFPNKATTEQAIAGTDDETYMTPAKTKQAISGGDYDVEIPIQYYGSGTTVYGTNNNSFNMQRSGFNYFTFQAPSNSIYNNSYIPTKNNTGNFEDVLAYNEVEKIEFECDVAYNSGSSVLIGFGVDNGPTFYTSSDTNAKILLEHTTTNTTINLNTGSGSSQSVGTSVSVSDYTQYNKYKVVFEVGVNVKLYLNGTLVDTKTTDLPTNQPIFFGMGSPTAGHKFGLQNVKVRIKYT